MTWQSSAGCTELLTADVQQWEPEGWPVTFWNDLEVDKWIEVEKMDMVVKSDLFIFLFFMMQFL